MRSKFRRSHRQLIPSYRLRLLQWTVLTARIAFHSRTKKESERDRVYQLSERHFYDFLSLSRREIAVVVNDRAVDSLSHGRCCVVRICRTTTESPICPPTRWKIRLIHTHWFSANETMTRTVLLVSSTFPVARRVEASNEVENYFVA